MSNIISHDFSRPSMPEEVKETEGMIPDHVLTQPKAQTPQELPADIRKAAGILQAALEDQMAFVIIGIKPSNDGADFYTAAYGEPGDLRNAYDHLPDLIQKLYVRKKLL